MIRETNAALVKYACAFGIGFPPCFLPVRNCCMGFAGSPPEVERARI